MKEKYIDVNAKCGEYLKRIRMDSGLKQKEFAESLEVAPSTIWEIESGNTNPGYGLLVKLYKVYRVDPNYILFGEGEPYVGPKALNPNNFNFGEQTEDIIDMFEKMEQSPIMRFSLIAYAKKFYRNNRGIIEMDIETHSRKKKSAIENKK